MPQAILVLVLFCFASVAAALGELEIRDIWSRSIDAAAKGACKGEDKRNVVKKLGYAAVLIVHNEQGEARTVLESAREAARSEECKKAIEVNLAPPGEGDKRVVERASGGENGKPRSGGAGASGK